MIQTLRRAAYQYGFQRRMEQASRLLADLPCAPAARVLDVGCGSGKMILKMQTDYPATEWVGVESSPTAYQQAIETGCNVVRGDAQLLPFESESFIAVLVSATLKHVPDAQRALRECRRVLVPNGRLLLLEPTPLGIWIGLKMGHFDQRYLHHVWSLPMACAELKSQGFDILQTWKFMLTPMQVPLVSSCESFLGGLRLTGSMLEQAVLARKSHTVPPQM